MRVYLDNAATSFPKPSSVYDAVDRYQRENGASVGRGSYREAIESQRLVERCRQRAAMLLGAEHADRIVFTFSGTDGLNLALAGLCRPGDHIVTTEIEHNSVLRPLRWLSETRGVQVTKLQPAAGSQIDLNQLRKALRPETRLVAIQHASNVTGVIQPIDEIGELVRSHGSLFLVDAAQTAGHIPIDLSQLPVDALVCPGHKGLLGPLGTGLVYLRSGLEQHVNCYRLGGTGSQSEDEQQPTSMPDRYESGNHNAPGLVGLNAALEFLLNESVERIHATEQKLANRLHDGFMKLPGVRSFRQPSTIPQVGVIPVTIQGFAPHEAASILDDSFGVQVRAGLHCAPGAHRWLKTFDEGGTIRFSVGPFNTETEIDHAIESVRQISGS